MKIRCPHCEARLVSSHEQIGQQTQCPRCRRQFTVHPKDEKLVTLVPGRRLQVSHVTVSLMTVLSGEAILVLESNEELRQWVCSCGTNVVSTVEQIEDGAVACPKCSYRYLWNMVA